MVIRMVIRMVILYGYGVFMPDVVPVGVVFEEPLAPHVFRFFFQHEFSIFPAGKFGILCVCFFLKGNQICWVFCEFLLLSGLGAPQDVTAQLFPVLPWDACLRMPSLWQQGKGTKAGGRGRGAPQVYSCVTPFAGAG
jgi:hypothetical protein